MIYKDSFAHKDNAEYPAIRPGKCLNCGLTYGHHNGWACSFENHNNFYFLNEEDRFITATMKGSITPMPFPKLYDSGPAVIMPWFHSDSNHTRNPPKKESPDISDWKAWQHNQPGECACGIHRKDCEYHK